MQPTLTPSGSDDEYKVGGTWKEDLNLPPPRYGNTGDVEAYDDIEEKKLIRKIDWRLLPILGALYSISLASYHHMYPEANN